MAGIDEMIKAAVGCVKCGAPLDGCDCWTKCKCGWRFEKGGKCSNPKCGGDGVRSVVAVASKGA